MATCETNGHIFNRDALCIFCATPVPPTPPAPDAVREAVDAEREACARIADGWANSRSCTPGQACEHQRLAMTIAQRIRERAASRATQEGT